MKLSQFIQKYPNKMFIRCFFDIEYYYGVTRHVCVYLKYEQNQMRKAEEYFHVLFDMWNTAQLDNKRTIRGYDKIFTAQQLKQQIKNPQNYQVQIDDQNYYFLDIF